jgi:hypothetical protein
MDLLQRFVSLPASVAPGCYTAESDAGRLFRVGRSHEGHPAILIAFKQEMNSSVARRLANIVYTPPCTVEIVGGRGQRRAERLAILECRTTEPYLCEYFFRVFASILLEGDGLTDEVAFESALEAVVTLFRSLQRPGLRTVQGLWGELAVIAWARDPNSTLSSWHSSPRALHDFAAGDSRLEVKGTVQPLREHTFLLDQLSVRPPGKTLVASMMLQEADDGASVDDLVASINLRVGTEPRRRLEAILAESLGQGWRDAGETKFSLQGARESLRVYLADQIPTVLQPLPPEIKEVRFVADLSTTIPLPIAEARILATFFGAILPDGEI